MVTTGCDRTPALIGRPFAPIGMGEHCRCSWRAFRALGLALPLRDVCSENRSDPALEDEFGEHVVQTLGSGVNIFHTNGDEVRPALSCIGGDLPSDGHNVIYPLWELSIYPEDWAKQLDHFHEIWAPSKFIFDSISRAVSRPVFHMPLATEVKLTSFLGRTYFGLPEDSYLFLFYFDFSSYIDRKNPFAVMRAFERAQAECPDQDTHLVVKLNRPAGTSHWEAGLARFMRALEESRLADRAIVIDRTLTDNEIKNLVRCCDCFVSLHRSEGYGKGMAEAMSLGKPVIATGYSGNLDFMTDTNSCLVRYSLIDVEEGQYPHAEGQVWAEPDIDHAVDHMVRLLADRDYGRALAENASRDMRVHFSYRATGLRYQNRLEQILRDRAARPQ